MCIWPAAIIKEIPMFNQNFMHNPDWCMFFLKSGEHSFDMNQNKSAKGNRGCPVAVSFTPAGQKAPFGQRLLHLYFIHFIDNLIGY